MRYILAVFTAFISLASAIVPLIPERVGGVNGKTHEVKPLFNLTWTDEWVFSPFNSPFSQETRFEHILSITRVAFTTQTCVFTCGNTSIAVWQPPCLLKAWCPPRNLGLLLRTSSTIRIHWWHVLTRMQIVKDWAVRLFTASQARSEKSMLTLRQLLHDNELWSKDQPNESFYLAFNTNSITTTTAAKVLITTEPRIGRRQFSFTWIGSYASSWWVNWLLPTYSRSPIFQWSLSLVANSFQDNWWQMEDNRPCEKVQPWKSEYIVYSRFRISSRILRPEQCLKCFWIFVATFKFVQVWLSSMYVPFSFSLIAEFQS